MWRNRTPSIVGLIFFSHILRAFPAAEPDISGNWVVDDPNSPYWLVLTQKGESITGYYTLQDGRVGGIFRAGVLELTWQQTGNRRGGTATLTLSPDQQVLSGSWQYNPKVFNSGLTGSGPWTFRRPRNVSPPPTVAPRAIPTPSQTVSPRSSMISIGFDQMNPGPVSPDALSSQGIRLVSAGTPTILIPGPEMVLPPGRHKILGIKQDRTTSVMFAFDRPVRRFGLTRIGVVNGASVPTWKLEALDQAGHVVDSIGEEHGLYQQPRDVSIQGANIMAARLTTDNRFGTGTWATYNSLPIAEIQLEPVETISRPPQASPIVPPAVTPPFVASPSPRPTTPPPRPTAPPSSPTPTATTRATETPAIVRSPTPTATASRATPTAPASTPPQKIKPRSPEGLGKPDAVIAAIQKSGAQPPKGGHDEAIAEGAFIVLRPDSWEVADSTENSAMFVSQDLPNTGVLFEWESGKSAAGSETARQLKEEHPDLESLPDGTMGGITTHRFAWVETAEPDRREALCLTWTAGDTTLRATAIAPAAAWKQHPEKILALLNGRAGEKKATTPKPRPSPSPTETPFPTGTATPIPTPSPTPTPTETPMLTKAGATVKTKKPAPSSGQLESKTIGDGALTVSYDESWKIAESGTSGAAISTIKIPELKIWVQWSEGKGKSLDQIANETLSRLRSRYAIVDALPNRMIAGAPARQAAWLTSEGGQKQENLQLDWIVRDTLFRATIAAPPEIWQKQGPQILRLLEDLKEGGG